MCDPSAGSWSVSCPACCHSPPRSSRCRMSGAPPSYCFVALPPRAKDGLVVFGKNSARPRDEVQEVVYFPAVDHEAESKVEVSGKVRPPAPPEVVFLGLYL